MNQSTSTASNVDFSDRWSPMTVREIRQGLRQPFFIWPFIILHFLVLGSLATEWNTLQATSGSGLPPAAAVSFWVLVFVMVGFLMPFRNFDALRGDLDQGNNEILVLSGLTRWQIVNGKSWVQFLLTLLTICSLLPYVLVRYFFGAFQIWVNAGLLVLLCTTSFSMSGVIVGASGYKSLGKKISFLLLGTTYMGILTAGAVGTTLAAAEGLPHFWSGLVAAYVVLCIALTQLYLGVLGLQVGRGHLKIYLRPWESPPTSAMMGLFIMSPAILFMGVLISLGVGAIIPIGLLLFLAITYDRKMRSAPTYQAPYYQPPSLSQK